MSLMKIQGVGKHFGKSLILQNINLEIPEGGIFGIIGINGSGKTTLLKISIGFYKADGGEIFYHDQPLEKALPRIKREFGFTTQNNSFYAKLTVEENIRYFGALYGCSGREIAQNLERVLILMELQDVRMALAEDLSGGMQRRLDMACSMIHEPRVLILDEPTEDLDSFLRRDILRLIKKINSLGTTIILTSHLLDDVENVCDRVAILHDHTIVKMGTVEELRKEYRRTDEIHLETASAQYEEIVKSLHIADFVIEEGKLVIYAENAEKMLHEVLHIIENMKERLLYVDIRKPSLREVFEVLTNKKWLENYSL